ncbi:MAG: hypothetical protein AAGA85_12175 [Bacteroidota bacterium]
MNDFEERLKEGRINSLGKTEEVVSEVLADTDLMEELFNCYFSDDEWVRLRTSSAVKRVTKAKKELVIPYIDRLLHEISRIDQASTQWTLAQLFALLREDMTEEQIERATKIMQGNLESHNDWIVLNQTMGTLGEWSQDDMALAQWLVPHLERLREDPRKSVARRASKLLGQLEK